ncbi:MAG: hypothetical protein ACRC8A_18255 [Microcoleaceae cyanobacterium]
MSSLKLDEVVKNLEKDIHLGRIKKIMFCACRGQWENEAEKLTDIPVKQLVQELYLKTQTLDRLYQLLDYILSKINKKSDYSSVINTILSQVSKLYFEDVKDAESESTQQITPVKKSSESSKNPNESLEKELINIRFNVMQHSNPLRLKLLLFSSLEHEFSYSEQDWSRLRSQSLDALIQQIFNTFPTLLGLESHLQKLAEYLDHPDENLQAATVLIETLSPLYARRVALGLSDTMPDRIQGLSPLITSPTFADLSDSKVESLSMPADGSPAIDFSESQTVHIVTAPIVTWDSNTVDQSATQLEHRAQDLTENFAPSDLPEQDSDPNFQQLTAEQRVQVTVDRNLRIANRSVTELFNQLNVSLETDCLQDQTAEQRLELKSQGLRTFLQGLYSDVARLEQTLDPDPIAASTPPPQKTSALNQQKLMELAQQGNGNAIAQLLNQSLKPRGIRAQAQIKGDCLQVVLDSTEAPDRALTAPFVHKKLMFLNLSLIQLIKIYGRKSGSQSVAWTQEFTN